MADESRAIPAGELPQFGSGAGEFGDLVEIQLFKLGRRGIECGVDEELIAFCSCIDPFIDEVRWKDDRRPIVELGDITCRGASDDCRRQSPGVI